MGKNKDLRKKILGLEESAWKHKLKLENESRKEFPNRDRMKAWRREIKAFEERISRLKKRLKRGE